MDQQQINNLLIQQLSHLTPAYIFWVILFSFLGLGYFRYGRKQSDFVLLSCGISLMLFPYFVSNTYLLALIGIIIALIPYSRKLTYFKNK